MLRLPEVSDKGVFGVTKGVFIKEMEVFDENILELGRNKEAF